MTPSSFDEKRKAFGRKYLAVPIEDARLIWIDRLTILAPDQQLREIRQILTDLLDVVEMKDEETPVLAAYDAFNASLKEMGRELPK